MTDTADRIRISQVATVFAAVAGEDRALELYLDDPGFEKRTDFRRPGSAIAIALVPPSEGQSAGSEEAHCSITTEDVEADHATLRARRVVVDAEIARTGKPRSGLVSIDATVADPVPARFLFRDTDGNRFPIVQPD